MFDKLPPIVTLIAVPSLTVLLILVLIFLLRKRPEGDAASSLAYGISVALSAAKSAQSRKDIRKLDLSISRLQLICEQTSLTDKYEIAPVNQRLSLAKEACYSLLAVNPDACEIKRYLPFVIKELENAAGLMIDICGIAPDTGHKSDYNIFSKKAKAEKARRYLNSIDEDR